MAFEILTADQLIQKLKGKNYKYSQVHHTYQPDHADFNGKNHLALQQGMKNYHVNTRGWDDIGQHVTLMPDGLFVTGRPFNQTPAGISGYNTGSFMVEMLGNFDKGKDKLEGKQLEAMLKLQHFLVSECGAEIMFHREHANKSCPGTGLDKEDFLKRVKNYDTPKIDKKPVPPKYPDTLFKVKSPLIHNDHVKKIQQQLNKKAGKTVVVEDSYYGNDTAAQIKIFQGKNGLKKDGIVGKLTWDKLFK